MAKWYVQMVGDPPILSVHEAEDLYIADNVWQLLDADGVYVAAFPNDAILGVWKDQCPEYTFDPPIKSVW